MSTPVCAVCGELMSLDDCMACDGEGEALLFPEHPINEDDCDWDECPECGGTGKVWVCCPGGTPSAGIN